MDELHRIDRDLEVIINEVYAQRVETLVKEARKRKNDENNPAFRLLQILGHMRRLDAPPSP